MTIKEMIKMAAGHYGLPADIIFGVCMTESAMDPLAVRMEPNYKWLYKPEQVKPGTCSLETEKTLQKMSWGLMQVMGAVYREYGFAGWLNSISTLPEAQLDFGCRHLAAKIRRYGLEAGILAYNSGSPRKNEAGQYVNIEYLKKVQAAALKF